MIKKRKIHIIAIQATKIKQTGITYVSGYTFFNRTEANGYYGVEFLENKYVKDNIRAFTSIYHLSI